MLSEFCPWVILNVTYKRGGKEQVSMVGSGVGRGVFITKEKWGIIGGDQQPLSQRASDWTSLATSDMELPHQIEFCAKLLQRNVPPFYSDCT